MQHMMVTTDNILLPFSNGVSIFFPASWFTIERRKSIISCDESELNETQCVYIHGYNNYYACNIIDTPDKINSKNWYRPDLRQSISTP